MEKYDVNFKKRYGQNFLRDTRVVKRIVNVADIKAKSLVIEVGPGGAIMTRELATIADNVLAYEIDKDLEDELYSRLHDFSNTKILFTDFLNSNLCDDVSKYDYEYLYFVSNVPYYITTPIILKLIKSGLHFEKIVMMVQKEVGDRFCVSPGSKTFGSISAFLQYYFNIKKEFFVSKKEFVPVPKVDSVIISFSERKDKEYLKSEEFFEKIIRDSFQYKRKTIRNNLKSYDLHIVESVLNNYGYDLSVRAENLDVRVFVEIANALFE